MSIYAIDPGTQQSALLVVCDSGTVSGRILPNVDLLVYLRGVAANQSAHLVVEEIQSYGMAVGREVFETVMWSGRFIEAWNSRGLPFSLMPRRDVKLTLCGSPKAKDPNIRQALIDRYGGAASAKKGGPLAGIKSHLWAALAVAETYKQLQQEQSKGRTR